MGTALFRSTAPSRDDSFSDFHAQCRPQNDHDHLPSGLNGMHVMDKAFAGPLWRRKRNFLLSGLPLSYCMEPVTSRRYIVLDTKCFSNSFRNSRRKRSPIARGTTRLPIFSDHERVVTAFFYRHCYHLMFASLPAIARIRHHMSDFAGVSRYLRFPSALCACL